MQNDKGEVVDMYLPRKCSATNRIIAAKDHASVQINFAKVDDKGHAIPNQFYTYALSGMVRQQGEADDCINNLTDRDGVTKGVF